jgi:hypothetical protein
VEEQDRSAYIKNEEFFAGGGGGKESSRRKAAAKRPRKQEKAKPRYAGIVLWPVFFILICGIFMLNRDAIRGTLEKTQVWERLTGRAGTEQSPEIKVIPEFPAAPENRDPVLSAQIPQPRDALGDHAGVPDPFPQTAPADGRSVAEAGGEDRTGQAETQTASVKPPAAAAPPQPAGTEGVRDRALYYIQLDSGDGTILSIKVLRKIPVSDSPMLDALEALLQGPSEEERGKGLISLIPENVKILNAWITGKTAYISFNEDFQYNQYGAEGYIAQLRQIVWTATEFSTVEEVQFLIEGRRVDYLGESIWIGSPLSRELLQFEIAA